ncbi:NUDIX domain-containing protein [Olivibacter sitiensis]|uniref:NUDIX domain-containing protein n=1 Tax=Olivibacter sitiensis TaxID=376470 RepID=UPI00040128E4|nr:NUDIX domain-containing protein [Olivibacter sitiensis]
MKLSAGILLYRHSPNDGVLEFFLVHPGGPYFARKDAGWWTIPKGEPNEEEELLATAIREFEEETGYKPKKPFYSLLPVKQKGGKTVHCWAVEGDLDAEKIICNTFTLEWPPRSGLQKSFPEIDRAEWFSLDDALKMINEQQREFLLELWKRTGVE